MLVVKVEIWPGGNESKAKELTRAYIANDAKTSNLSRGQYGSYDAKFMQSIDFNPKKVWKKGHVDYIHRKRRGVWDIIYACLRAAGLETRNPEPPSDWKEKLEKEKQKREINLLTDIQNLSGYQPQGPADMSNPPKGGSGMPRK